MIDDATIERIARRTAELMRGENAQGPTVDILTRAEAKAYVKRFSDRAFDRWRRKWSVVSPLGGRYSKSLLDVALKREARAR